MHAWLNIAITLTLAAHLQKWLLLLCFDYDIYIGQMDEFGESKITKSSFWKIFHLTMAKKNKTLKFRVCIWIKTYQYVKKLLNYKIGKTNFWPANISTSDQLCFNVVDQCWNNVHSTLKMKQNPTTDCTPLTQRQCRTLN